MARTKNKIKAWYKHKGLPITLSGGLGTRLVYKLAECCHADLHNIVNRHPEVINNETYMRKSGKHYVIENMWFRLTPIMIYLHEVHDLPLSVIKKEFLEMFEQSKGTGRVWSVTS